MFNAESEHGIFKAILEAPVDLKSDPWPSISDGAKDLVRKMLCKDPQKRLTAFDVLSKYTSNIAMGLKTEKIKCFECYEMVVRLEIIYNDKRGE